MLRAVVVAAGGMVMMIVFVMTMGVMVVLVIVICFCLVAKMKPGRVGRPLRKVMDRQMAQPCVRRGRALELPQLLRMG